MSITTTERASIEGLLVLMFDAAPGATYLSQVVSMYESMGHNLADLANTLDDIPAYNTLNPNFQTAEEFAAAFLTPLGLEADAFAVNFIISKFNAGAGKGQIAYEALIALQGVDASYPAQYVNAKAILDNKVAVSEYYSVTVGVSQTNIDVLQSVLDGITADPATVTMAEAEIDAGTRGSAGVELTLTPSQDSIVGSGAADIINGLFGDATASNNTFTAGDSVDGGDGTDSLNLVALGTVASSAITVKNVESINIQDTVGATFNGLLVENAPGINFTNTLVGQTSMVTGVAVSGTVVGLVGAGNLTVDYATTSGTSDTASVALGGVGSSTASSTVTVSDGNTIEKVAVATTGSNFVTLVGGTAAASLTVTGDGTNTFTLSNAGALSAVATIDGSASTGTNTFALGTNFALSGTTVKGGTGADTVSATLAAASLEAVTLTGVETFATTWTDSATLDLAAATGLTTLTINDKAAAMGTVTVQNAQASLATVTVSNVAATAANSALIVGYGATTKGDLALKIGSTSATATAVDLGAVTISNSNSLNVTTLGALSHDFDNITVKGNQSTLGFTVAAGGSLTFGDALATGNIGALNITTGAGSFFSGQVDQSAGKTIGDVTINATGTGNETALRISGGTDVIGNISFTATGNDISGYVSATTSGGGMGNITMTITGDDSELGFGFSAGYVSGDSAPGEVGNVGNVTLTVTGDDNDLSGGVDVHAGDLGNITMTVAGDGNTVGFSGSAEHHYYYTSPTTEQASGYYYVDGGDIGTTSVNIDGDSSGNLSLYSSGGSIGDVTVVLDNSADLDIFVETDGGVSWIHDQPMTTGDIGNISVTLGDDATISGAFSADGGDIGNVTVSVMGDGASGSISFYAAHASGGYGWETGDSDDHFKGGNVGDVTVTIDGDQATMGTDVTASGGDIGAVNVSVNGNGASGWMDLNSHLVGSGGTGGGTGAINITLADDTGYDLSFDVDGALGALTVVAGDDVWFDVSGGGGNGGATAGSPASTSATSLTFGNGAEVMYHVGGFSGSVGAITAAYGDGAEDDYSFVTIDGSVGALNLTHGAGADTTITYNSLVGSAGAVNYTAGAGSDFTLTEMTGVASMGKVTLTGGDSGSTATITVNGGAVGSHAGVDATAWTGSVAVDLTAVTPTGTTIRVGTGGSSVSGTQGADNIFLGTGVDTVVFDVTPTNTDTVFNFTTGATKDVMNLVSAATALEAVITADAASNGTTGDILRLVDIAAGQDITTTAGLIAAVEGGEYTSVTMDAAANFTIITSASTTASTFYVFNVIDDGDQVFEAGEVVLVGVVNATAASAIGGLVISNFA